MTSSLVGSEMCIRDRLWDRQRSLSRTSPKSLPRVRTNSWKVGASGSRSCLLYTSDAADDM
eukprot:4934314-Prorocentrum_lima.AAC.1